VIGIRPVSGPKPDRNRTETAPFADRV